MILCPVVWFFPPVEFVNYLCVCHWNWTGRKIHTTAVFCFLTNTLIWLFFLKTGSIITQIKSVWCSNQQWLVQWVTLLHNKKSQHCWLTCIADQGKWIEKKNQYCKKAGVKIGGLCYHFISGSIIFSPVEFCELLAATCLRFLVVCGCHWNRTGREKHTTAN